MLELLACSAARRQLQKDVGADGEQLLVAALADTVRQLVAGSAHTGLGVTRRRVLFHLGAFREAAMELLDDDEPITNVEVLDRLVQIGDLIQSGDTLFPVPLRAVETPAPDAWLLLGTESSKKIAFEKHVEIRAAGVGRIINSIAAGVLGAPRDSLDSWLAQPAIENFLDWMAAVETQLRDRGENAVLEADGIEVLSRPEGSVTCSWQPLAASPRSVITAVISRRGTSLIRLVNGRRVLGYVAVLGDPAALLKGRVKMTRLSLNDGKRFHLALRAAQDAARLIRWSAPSSITGNKWPLRIAWSEVPYPEAAIRTLGTSFPISEGKRGTAFVSELMPTVNYLFGRLGLKVETVSAT